MSERLRVLLVQLGSTGDCLFVTTIARQIKEVNYPGCHLTWLIGSGCRSVIDGNPYVDAVLEIPIPTRDTMQEQRESIPQHVEALRQTAHFDKVFITDYTGDKSRSWFGTTRSSLFRGYPHAITVNVDPILVLTRDEIERVKAFAKRHAIPGNRGAILFECSPQSGQSHMTADRALGISYELIRRFPGLKIILSSSERMKTEHSDIIDGSSLTYRENAELTKYCTLLVGCSSGISWLNTSSAAARLPMIQNVNPRYLNALFTASIDIDFKYFGMNTTGLIELLNGSDADMIDCVACVLQHGFAYARRQYRVRHQAYYGGKRFLLDVLRIGSYRRGNMSNLRLLLFLLKCELIRSLSPRRFVNRVPWPFKN